MVDSLMKNEGVTPPFTGLAGQDLKRLEHPRVLLTYTSERQPPCEIIPAMMKLEFDIIGPTKFGADVFDMVHAEKPDVINLRVDDGFDHGFDAIPDFWERFKTPVVVVTTSQMHEAWTGAADAGAFGVLNESATLSEIQATFRWAALRGSALREAQHRIVQLEKNLTNRRVVEQAKWKLVQEEGMNEPDAHQALQSVARNTRAPLIEIAQAVIDGKPLPRLPNR